MVVTSRPCQVGKIIDRNIFLAQERKWKESPYRSANPTGKEEQEATEAL